jgi:hypothetical protein
MPPPKWYASSAPLGLMEDKYWLSELQCYLRSSFAEVFGATDQEMGAQAYHGRNKPMALGQVGIRCKYCKRLPFACKGPQSVSYPSQITGIYNSVQQMFRLHLDACSCVPDEVRTKLEALKDSSSSRGGRKQYWVDSAKRLGLCDTPHGIHFGRDPTEAPPPLEDQEHAKYGPADVQSGGGGGGGGGGTGVGAEGDGEKVIPTKGKYISPDLDWERAVKKEKENSYPLVTPEDAPLISDYLFLTMEQMEPCKLMKADRVGCYKSRPVGFPGE